MRILFMGNPDDEKFMKEALGEASVGYMEGEVPIGAVAVKDGVIIARAHNQRRKLKDITAHAELLVLRKLSPKLENLNLAGITIYSTLEPCMMCAGALIHYRARRVVYGAVDLKFGASGSKCNLFENSGIEITGRVLDEDCRELLYRFFEKELHIPSKKWEDIELE